MTGNVTRRSPVRVSVDPGRSADFGSARRNSTGLYGGEPFHILTVFLGTGCMIKLQSSMSKHIPPFLVQIALGVVFTGEERVVHVFRPLLCDGAPSLLKEQV
ncbi:hypothetical protein CHARACLAT_018084 [Characodon lateralis]|uniref:Uncharacterized protein n=1 Tax=Characodon lateralis TaxID=208331 RepID=A0ABU7F4M0_9TELE|nr:hypothetical protein [Characodon lateralis]